MKRKDIGLFLSVSILAFMAVFSEKKVLVTTGYAVSQDELDVGQNIYFHHCETCHNGRNGGAPRVGDPMAWERRLSEGMDTLIVHTIQNHQRMRIIPQRGSAAFDGKDMAAAIAFMVRESEDH